MKNYTLADLSMSRAEFVALWRAPGPLDDIAKLNGTTAHKMRSVAKSLGLSVRPNGRPPKNGFYKAVWGPLTGRKPVVSNEDRALINGALAAGRVTKCPPGWHLGHRAACLAEIGL